jgi:hypothetical protein
MADYAGMSVEDLQAKNEELMEKRAQVSAEVENEQLEVTAALDEAIARRQLESQVDTMSDAEREVMTQLLAEPRKVPEEGGGTDG